MNPTIVSTVLIRKTSLQLIVMHKKKVKRSMKVYYPYRDYKHVRKILKMFMKRFLATNEIAESLGSRKWEYPQDRTLQIMERLKELGYCKEHQKILGSKHECGSTAYMVTKEGLDGGLKNIMGDGKSENEIMIGDRKSKKVFTCNDDYILGRLLPIATCCDCYKTVECKLDEGYKILKQARYWSLTPNGELATLVLLNKQDLYSFIEACKRNNIILNLADVLLKQQKREYVDMLIKDLESESENSLNLIAIAEKWYSDMNKMIMDWDVDEEHYPLLAKYKEDLINARTQRIVMRSRRYR